MPHMLLYVTHMESLNTLYQKVDITVHHKAQN